MQLSYPWIVPHKGLEGLDLSHVEGKVLKAPWLRLGTDPPHPRDRPDTIYTAAGKGEGHPRQREHLQFLFKSTS